MRSTVRIATRLAALALLVYLGVRLWQLWSRDPVDFARADAGLASLSVVVAAAAVAGFGFVWIWILRQLGALRASAGWIGLFFQGQLGKYLPGSVWQYAGRVALVHRRGVPVRTGLSSIVVEVVASAVAAGVVAALALPFVAAVAVWAGGALVLGGVALALRRRVPAIVSRLTGPDTAPAARAMPRAAALYVPVWLAYGVAFWLTARALFAVPFSDLPHDAGVFAAAWIVGLVVVFAPGGLGVREAVIVALLSGRLGEAHAIALAAASRLVLTALDLAGGAAAFALPPLVARSKRTAVGVPE